ncbi:hypothetical protein ANANG_G00195760 [Anguilla anguilla]|uniref:Uncharacterized protein n=1 Tax=Anguilla anguilla TaxID=7936 RepID=A0A9D3RVK9_ANGAN|nr:hypothetical protein ANANG_G00195760 [Anguilla anguilla]
MGSGQHLLERVGPLHPLHPGRPAAGPAGIGSRARPSSEDWQLRIVGTLHDILAVVVEYWCQEHSRQNRHLVEKGLADLGQYIAILCHDLPPEALQEFIPSIPSVRLRMVTADAVFSHLCSQNGVVTGTEPLSLTKIVSSYLPALVRMSGRAPRSPGPPPSNPRPPAAPRTEGRPPPPPPSPRGEERGEYRPRLPSSLPAGDKCETRRDRRPRRRTAVQTGRAAEEAAAPAAPGGPGSGKQNVPRGLNRVNAAGETLLHRACKTDQVETVLRVLPLPGIDVNVKDYAGWTPLHEACNHGSSACVRALLEHCPALHLETQVDGVSPLHDALLNGHLDIAKMLLRHGGSSLLRQRDGHGRTALDLVSSPELQEDLRTRARGRTLRPPPRTPGVGGQGPALPGDLRLPAELPDPQLRAGAGRPHPGGPRPAAGPRPGRPHRRAGDGGLGRPGADPARPGPGDAAGGGAAPAAAAPSRAELPGRHTRVLMRQLEQLESDGAELLGNAPA